MKLNKHNLKMVRIKEASGMTKGLKGYYSAHYVQISYDLDSGEIYTDFHCSLGQNSWSQYRDNVITVCNATSQMTMQQIADLINYKVQKHKAFNNFG